MKDFPAPKHPLMTLLDRQMVEACDVTAMAEFLLPMTETPESIREYAGRIGFAFEGYDDDSRELYVIPEVRRFVHILTRVFPYWFHFCNKVDESLFVVMACLLPIASSSKSAGEVTSHFEAGNLSSVIHKLFTAVNGLYAHHGLTNEENDLMTSQVSSYMNTYMNG
jgi:hypothetical protein